MNKRYQYLRIIQNLAVLLRYNGFVMNFFVCILQVVGRNDLQFNHWLVIDAMWCNTIDSSVSLPS